MVSTRERVRVAWCVVAGEPADLIVASSDALERFAASAAELGVVVEATRYPEGTRTAVHAAAAVGCDVAQIVKSLVLTGPDGPVLVLTSGASKVDVDALAGVLGGDTRMATADEVRAATGYAIGGTPPFGHPAPLRTLIDPALLGHDEVYAAAGTPDSCFPLTPARLVEATGAAGADIFV